jgi:SOS-response transcriptional repressors (RecA-mediated autopeptidases)
MQRITVPNKVLLLEVTRLLDEGQIVILRVKGNSMLPFIIGDRDSVVLQKARLLQPGDIVLAHLEDGRYVLHRVIRCNGDDIILMGDGNLQGAERCKRIDIVGQAIKIIRNGRYVDCSARSERRNAELWKRLLSLRRYLLAVYRRTR